MLDRNGVKSQCVSHSNMQSHATPIIRHIAAVQAIKHNANARNNVLIP